MNIKIDFFDRNQGKDKDGRTYGYAGIDDQGGYFFTWLPTLRETLDSIEPDKIDPPQYFSQRALWEIRRLIRQEWTRQKTKLESLIPRA